MKHLGFPPDPKPKEFHFYDSEGNLIEDEEDPEYMLGNTRDFFSTLWNNSNN
jgi:hypothetical protein